MDFFANAIKASTSVVVGLVLLALVMGGITGTPIVHVMLSSGFTGWTIIGCWAPLTILFFLSFSRSSQVIKSDE